MTPDSFIQTSLALLPDDVDHLVLALARFDAAVFAPSLFAHYRIECRLGLQGKPYRRQAEYLAGRCCARAVLDFHGHPGFALHTTADRAPAWPPAMVGSITHKGPYAAAIAHPARNLAGIGVDIETVIEAPRVVTIAAAVMTPAELALIEALVKAVGEEARALLVTLVFSAKESFFKAAFAEVGELFGFDAVALEHADLERALLRFRCVRTLAARLPAGARFEARLRRVDADTVLTWVPLRLA